jgi:hypothetical protein
VKLRRDVCACGLRERFGQESGCFLVGSVKSLRKVRGEARRGAFWRLVAKRKRFELINKRLNHSLAGEIWASREAVTSFSFWLKLAFQDAGLVIE